MNNVNSSDQTILPTESCPSSEEIHTLLDLCIAKKYKEAEILLQGMMERFPDYAFGWTIYGEVCKQLGQSTNALSHMQKAVVLSHANPDVHANLGNYLQELGRFEDAMCSYKFALKIDSNYVPAHYNLGIILQRMGKFEDARTRFEVVLLINPDYVEAHINLGVTLKSLGRLNEAEASYRWALQAKPDYAEAHSNLGNTLKELGRFNEAESCYRQALRICPDDADTYFNLGIILHELGRLDEAEASYQSALIIKPDFIEVLNNLGNTLKELGRLNEAETSYRRALQFNPELAELYNNLAVALKDLASLEEAEANCRRALQINPDFAGAHNNLGLILKVSGHVTEAEISYRRALEVQPEYAEAHTNLAITLLTLGNLTAGWREYEWRWATSQMIKGRRNFAQPQWRGEVAAGKTLLIHSEQGLGDTLQFCRYAFIAKARGLKVVLEVQPPLVRLLSGMHGIDCVIGAGETLPAFDLYCPMMSMPLVLNTTLDNIPCPIAYLKAGKTQTEAWEKRLAALPNRRQRIGLVWAGNSHVHWPQAAAIDRQRSLLPQLLAPILDLSGFEFFSLQKGGIEAPESFRLHNFMAEMDDFADTAALIVNLDLVISVDTAVAHLAGALGKPVWVLNRFDSCWRWLRGREDSPWYSSMRLFRQPTPGDWQAVINQVVEALVTELPQ